MVLDFVIANFFEYPSAESIISITIKPGFLLYTIITRSSKKFSGNYQLISLEAVVLATYILAKIITSTEPRADLEGIQQDLGSLIIVLSFMLGIMVSFFLLLLFEATKLGYQSFKAFNQRTSQEFNQKGFTQRLIKQPKG